MEKTLSKTGAVRSSAESALLACPFCGGRATYDEADDGGKYVRCTYCNSSSALHYDRCENLIDWWNRRSAKKEPDVARYLLDCLKSHHMTRGGISTLVKNAEKMLAG